MANQKHLEFLNEGTREWNRWRSKNRPIKPDLRDVNLEGRSFFYQYGKYELRGPDFRNVDFRNSNLKNANVRGGCLCGADLSNCDLTFTDFTISCLRKAKLTGSFADRAKFDGSHLNGANLDWATLWSADFQDANLEAASLRNTKLSHAILVRASFQRANLSGADLTGATLIRTNLTGANLSGCKVFGVSAWKLDLTNAVQNNLVIGTYDEDEYKDPIITVDNIEVAQFIYLLLNNDKLRSVIDTITSKVVLILGRFSPERKRYLDAIRDELRKYDYLPVLFDFSKPSNRDTVETMSTLAHMAAFVIADLTDAKSILQELQRVIPSLPSVPIQPILSSSASESGMLDHLKRYPWFLAVHRYRSLKDLILSLKRKVIGPAEAILKYRQETKI